VEFGGYRPQEVSIKLNGQHREAYTHVPLSISPTGGHPPSQYLDTMLTGATEHRLSQALSELRAIRQQLG
jgi:hypothetical protein